MATSETRKLSMVFASTAGKFTTLTLDSPTEELFGETVGTAMENLINTEVFTDNEGNPLSQIKTAKLIRTTVEDLL